MDPRDMTPRQIIEVLGIAGRVSVVVFFDGGGDISCDGVGDNVAWNSPADFARLVEERRRKTDAEVLAADIAKARKQLPNMRQEPQSLLASIGWRIARGILLPEWKQPVVEQHAKPAAPQEDPPLTVAEVVNWLDRHPGYRDITRRDAEYETVCATRLDIPELTAIVRGGAK